MEQWNRNRSKT